MTKRGTVRSGIDPAHPPPMTPEQEARLDALAARPEEAIDYSDIPPLDERFWARAARNPFWRPVKQQLTVRLDADVLAWLQSGGPGYQSRMNDILRQAMLRAAPKR